MTDALFTSTVWVGSANQKYELGWVYISLYVLLFMLNTYDFIKHTIFKAICEQIKKCKSKHAKKKHKSSRASKSRTKDYNLGNSL